MRIDRTIFCICFLLIFFASARFSSSTTIDTTKKYHHQEASITSDSSTFLYAVWRQVDVTDSHIYVSKSYNRGKSWFTPARIDNAPYGHQEKPDIAFDSSKKSLHIVWTGQNIDVQNVFHSTSSNSGSSWSEPQVIDTLNNGKTEAVTIEAGGGKIYVAFQSRGSGQKYAIYVITSTNGGESWSSPKKVSTDTTKHHRNPDLAVSSDGNTAYVFWESGSSKKVLFSSKSSNAGISWSSPAEVKTGGTNQRHASAIYDSKHNQIVVAFEDNFDTYFAKASLGSMSWSSHLVYDAESGSGGGWEIWPSIIADNKGTLFIIWDSYFQIQFSSSTNNGVNWTVAEKVKPSSTTQRRPSATLDRNGYVFFLWDEAGSDDIRTISIAHYNPCDSGFELCNYECKSSSAGACCITKWKSGAQCCKAGDCSGHFQCNNFRCSSNACVDGYTYCQNQCHESDTGHCCTNGWLSGYNACCVNSDCDNHFQCINNKCSTDSCISGHTFCNSTCHSSSKGACCNNTWYSGEDRCCNDDSCTGNFACLNQTCSLVQCIDGYAYCQNTCFPEKSGICCNNVWLSGKNCCFSLDCDNHFLCKKNICSTVECVPGYSFCKDNCFPFDEGICCRDIWHGGSNCCSASDCGGNFDCIDHVCSHTKCISNYILCGDGCFQSSYGTCCFDVWASGGVCCTNEDCNEGQTCQYNQCSSQICSEGYKSCGAECRSGSGKCCSGIWVSGDNICCSDSDCAKPLLCDFSDHLCKNAEDISDEGRLITPRPYTEKNDTIVIISDIPRVSGSPRATPQSLLNVSDKPDVTTIPIPDDNDKDWQEFDDISGNDGIDNDNDGYIDEDPWDSLDNDDDGIIDEDGRGGDGIDNDGDGKIDEDPRDGIDNDGDGKIDEDGAGSDIGTSFSLDGKDNDEDGYVDEDPWDGIDNDHDGLIDEDGCGSDGIDNDLDKKIDEDPHDGIDNDFDSLVDEDGLGSDKCRSMGNDGIDNDGDGKIDEDPLEGVDNDIDGVIDEDGCGSDSLDNDNDNDFDEDWKDHRDNDGDGKIDEDGMGADRCLKVGNDGIDNDNDGKIDEDPWDGLDNDGDGIIDEDGRGGDGIDNDGDGKIDEDPRDGIDNDGDGKIDEDGAGADIGFSRGNDNKDNDGDGKIDEDPWDGVDNDGDGIIDEDGCGIACLLDFQLESYEDEQEDFKKQITPTRFVVSEFEQLIDNLEDKEMKKKLRNRLSQLYSVHKKAFHLYNWTEQDTIAFIDDLTNDIDTSTLENDEKKPFLKLFNSSKTVLEIDFSLEQTTKLFANTNNKLINEIEGLKSDIYVYYKTNVISEDEFWLLSRKLDIASLSIRMGLFGKAESIVNEIKTQLNSLYKGKTVLISGFALSPLHIVFISIILFFILGTVYNLHKKP